MPYQSPRPCAGAGCRALTTTTQRYCPSCLAARRKLHDEQRGTAAQRGYDSRWKKLRAWWLSRNPLCAPCGRKSRVTEADTVDHKVPHRGDLTLMFDVTNLESMCRSCHSSGKQRQERRARKFRRDDAA